jgi:hypothetical protein
VEFINEIKMEAVATRTSKKSIDTLFLRLKKEYPNDVLERELRRMDALLTLGKVNGTVKQNDMTMTEIVNEVNKVRAERYARNKGRL